MAQELKLEVQTDQTTNYLYIYDRTGAYDVTQNPTGWGAPNAELNESCLMLFAKRIIDEDNEVICEFDTNQFIYDSVASNTDVKSFKILQDADGHFVFTLLRIPVSEDGETVIEGADIVDDQYVYSDSVLKQMINGVLEVVTDFSEVVGNEDIIQLTAQVLILAKAKVKHNQKHFELVEIKEAEDEDIDPYQDELNDLFNSIYGAQSQFYSGMFSAARDTVVKIHETYA